MWVQRLFAPLVNFWNIPVGLQPKHLVCCQFLGSLFSP